MSRIHKIKIFIAFFVLLSVYLGFSTNAYAENNTKETAESISLGKNVEDCLPKSEHGSQDKYYKIYLEEGQIYLISLYNKGTPTKEWDNFKTYLCYDSDNDNSEDYIKYYTEKDTINTLFRPDYSGYYYINTYASHPDYDIIYCFNVIKYTPYDTIVKDSDGNSYNITGNNSMEFVEVGSKNKDTFYFESSIGFSTIGGYDTVDSITFKITSVGKNSFKGTKYKRIVLSNEIKTIKTGAFQNCRKLTCFEMAREASLKKVEKNAFKGTKKGIKIYVPSVKKYKKVFKKCGASKPKYYITNTFTLYF